MSALLRTAVKWGHLQEKPARGVDLPALRTVRPKWVLTISRPYVCSTRCRRWGGRWRGWRCCRDCDAASCSLCAGAISTTKSLTVRQAVYEGRFDTPKTQAGVRQILLSEAALQLLADWPTRAKRLEPDALVFSTWTGRPISPNNVVRQQIFPACEALGLQRPTWLTFRRTYSSWAHEKGVPGKVIAQLLGHAKVDTTLNVYTQVMDGALRTAVDKIGSGLFTIVHNLEGAPAVTC